MTEKGESQVKKGGRAMGNIPVPLVPLLTILFAVANIRVSSQDCLTASGVSESMTSWLGRRSWF